MVEECLSGLPAALRTVSVCPPPEAFAALPEYVKERRAKCAQTALETPIPLLTASDWLIFFRTGDRASYEERYFARRRRLTDLVCGALSGDAERYLDAIVDTIWAICEESAWQMPAHNQYIRDTPQLTWPDTERPVIDLFAAETGALLTCACAALEHLLPEAAVTRVRREVWKRVLTPYQTEHFWWMGHGDGPMNNWTPWCTQNVLLCAFALPCREAVRRAVIAKAAYSLDCFLKDYGPDGCCNEGAQYYGHAGLCLYACLELLCEAAPGAFDGLWQEEKIRSIAANIYYLHIGGPYYVNFADCSPKAGRRGAREYCFARRTQNPAMARFAAQDWRESFADPIAQNDIARINLWYQLLETRVAAEMAGCEAPRFQDTPGDIFYPSVGVFIARRGDWVLAAKAGGNADSHNHNDTGSVTLYRGEKPFLIDLGVETYTQKTFSPQRYEIWTMQSQWHNLPTFDGVQQQDGVEFRAHGVNTQFLPEAAHISMELSAAWPAQARLDSLMRTVTLTAGGLTLTDTACGGYQTAFLTLMLREKPHVDGNRVAVGALGTILLEGVLGAVETDVLPIQDARLRIAWPDTLYRLRIPFSDSLTVRIV